MTETACFGWCIPDNAYVFRWFNDNRQLRAELGSDNIYYVNLNSFRQFLDMSQVF